MTLVVLGVALGGGAASASWMSTTSNVGSTMSAVPSFPRCYSNDVVTDNPLSYWRLNESSGTAAADAVGANTGTYVGSPTLGASGALADATLKAVTLSGSSQYISVPDAASLDTGDVMTLELWVKRTTLGTLQVLVDKGTSSYRLQLSTADTVQLTRAGTVIATSTVALSDTTQFHHVVATKNGATVKIYINGVDRTGAVSNQTLLDSPDPLRIGTASPTAANHAAAAVDEVAVYGSALSPARVLAHFASGRCYVDEPLVDNPVARWRLDGATDSSFAFDDIGGFNGMIKSGAAFGPTGPIKNDSSRTLGLNGTSGYIEVPYRAALTPSSYTIEAWAYPTGGAGTMRAVLASHMLGRGYILYAASSNNWEVYCANGSWTYTTGTPVRLNEWVHLAMTWNGTNQYFYINGASNGAYLPACGQQVGGPLRIGASNPIGSGIVTEYFPGRIADVAIYNTALSAARISAHYVAGRSYRDVVAETYPRPVGYWRLGEASGAAADAVGANTGTYVNTPSREIPGALSGDLDTAVTLNGTNQYVSVPDSTSLQTGDTFSAELWVRRSSTGTTQHLLNKGDNSYSVRFNTSNLVEMWKNTTGGPGHQLLMTSATGFPVTDTTTFHHIVVTKNAGQRKIYIDGVDRSGSAPVSRTLTNSAQALHIGAASPTAGSYTSGTVDEVAIYNVALSAEQVKVHFDAGRSAPR